MSTPATQLRIRDAARQKAAVRRASARARREANRLDARALKQLDEVYRRASIELQQAIAGYAGEDGNLRLQVLTDLKRQTDAIIDRLAGTRNTLLDGQLIEAAQIAVQPWTDIAPQVIVNVPQQAVNFVRNYVGDDGLNLSARLWRVDSGARQLVGSAVEQAVIQGHSASQAVNDFLSRGEPVPAGLKLQADQANAVRAGRLAGDALLHGENNPRANAMRVFRTELNRAHGEAYMMGGEDVPDFVGWRFLLSPRHPAVDICDMHANANLYGLGPGVYPDRDRCPWPAHPNTLSYTEIVFGDDITDEDRAGKESRLDYIGKQPQDKQNAILGSDAKGNALRAGVLRENHIATPWRILRQRYEQQGIDVEALTQ